MWMLKLADFSFDFPSLHWSMQRWERQTSASVWKSNASSYSEANWANLMYIDELMMHIVFDMHTNEICDNLTTEKLVWMLSIITVCNRVSTFYFQTFTTQFLVRFAFLTDLQNRLFILDLAKRNRQYTLHTFIPVAADDVVLCWRIFWIVFLLLLLKCSW